MKRVLILGGTGWLGHEIARAALNSGAAVTCLARGEAGGVPDGVELVRADRSLPGAYDQLSGEWDEVVELNYEQRLVASALDALADRAAHWTLISTISVYADDTTPGADESAELVEPRDLSAYADAKVAAERMTAERVGDRLLIARPGLIAGPGDPSERVGYWLARLLRGGQVLVPATAGRFVQFVDVADLAQWVVKAGADEVAGPVDAVGSIRSFASFLEEAREVTEFDGEFVEVSDEDLLAHDVQYWAGPRSLPLWIPIESAGFAQRDGASFLATGGVVRPMAESLARMRDDERARGIYRDRRAGLSAAEEAEVLAAVR